jgi:peptidoglycan hydrolase-like amidase
MRSPNVAHLVDVTRGEIIRYRWDLIKPWYFSVSNGRTLSALEYCKNQWGANCVDVPYLQSVADPAWVWKTQSWHGVGISWIGATYFANQGWDYKKIITYYLSGVTVQ